MGSFRILLCAAALGAAACGTGTSAPGPESSAGVGDEGQVVAELEVGTGTTAFEPLADGQSVPIIFGPQGGYHVWTALRVQRAKVSPDRAEVHVKLVQNDREVSQNAYRLNLVSAGEFYEWYGLQALVPDPTTVDGQMVTVRVELLDSHGVSVSHERRVVPHKN